MKRQGIVLALVVLGCVAVTGLVVFLDVSGRCAEIDWVKAPGFSSEWSASEAWCVSKKTNTRFLLQDRLEVQRNWGSSFRLRVLPQVHLAGNGYWATTTFFYGFSIFQNESVQEKCDSVFVYRVNEDGEIEICSQIDKRISFLRLLETGTEKEEEWADWIVLVADPDDTIREGRLRTSFGQCVDGSELESAFWRPRSLIFSLGLRRPSFEAFLDGVPEITIESISFDE